MQDRFLIGYARVSTDDQDLTLQRQALMRYGVPETQIIEEHASGKSMNRKQLKRILKAMRPGDAIVVWKLDRLGRTLTGVLEVLEHMAKNDVAFVSLTESFDTGTPMGKAFLQFALVMAELERNLISERTKAGIAAKRAAGATWGRKHAITDRPKRMARLRRLDREGRLRDAEGGFLTSAKEIRVMLNSCDPDGPHIKNDETVRRWRRGDPERQIPPWHRLEEIVDDPLDADDD